jgi:hypothetical protein
MRTEATPYPVHILALAPAPGVTAPGEFKAALMPSLGGITLLRLQLFGQYALADGKPHPCRTLQIDPNQISLSCEVTGHLGDRVDLNLDLLGELHGVIEARMAAGLRINVGDIYQDLIAQKLAWFKACLGQGATDMDFALFRERRSQRIVPRQTDCQFIDAEGGLQAARILNISRSGVAIASSYQPTIGAPIILAGTKQRRGLTVRRFDNGFAIAFLEQIPAVEFGPDMII